LRRDRGRRDGLPLDALLSLFAAKLGPASGNRPIYKVQSSRPVAQVQRPAWFQPRTRGNSGTFSQCPITHSRGLPSPAGNYIAAASRSPLGDPRFMLGFYLAAPSTDGWEAHHCGKGHTALRRAPPDPWGHGALHGARRSVLAGGGLDPDRQKGPQTAGGSDGRQGPGGKKVEQEGFAKGRQSRRRLALEATLGWLRARWTRWAEAGGGAHGCTWRIARVKGFRPCAG